MITRRLLLALVLLTACGVGTYRSAQVRGELSMRLVARDDQGEAVSRWFAGEQLHLDDEAIVDASHVREAQLETLPDGTQHIVLYLDEVGTQRLAAATRAHLGRRLAIVVDHRVVVAPIIRTEIDDGAAHITVGPEGDLTRVFEALTRAQ